MLVMPSVQHQRNLQDLHQRPLAHQLRTSSSAKEQRHGNSHHLLAFKIFQVEARDSFSPKWIEAHHPVPLVNTDITGEWRTKSPHSLDVFAVDSIPPEKVHQPRMKHAETVHPEHRIGTCNWDKNTHL